ncbi:hypothetical protein BaRGS_00017794 [Batillaria attramentaria]|uniref:Uncharacterized protein n=1 Tax=Batillaria attramentaria TaxID=370345 RepID=A0ABD0KUQ0_9CAEN
MTCLRLLKDRSSRKWLVLTQREATATLLIVEPCAGDKVAICTPRFVPTCTRLPDYVNSGFYSHSLGVPSSKFAFTGSHWRESRSQTRLGSCALLHGKSSQPWRPRPVNTVNGEEQRFLLTRGDARSNHRLFVC